MVITTSVARTYRLSSVFADINGIGEFELVIKMEGEMKVLLIVLASVMLLFAIILLSLTMTEIGEDAISVVIGVVSILGGFFVGSLLLTISAIRFKMKKSTKLLAIIAASITIISAALFFVFWARGAGLW